MAWRLSMVGQGVLSAVAGAWTWMTSEIWASVVILGLILLAALTGIYMQWRRRSRVKTAFRQLIDDARFEPITDEQRQQELGQCVHELLTGERVPPESAAPLAHAVSYRTEHLTLNVVHVAQSHRTAGVTEPDSMVVICDGFDVTLPEFRLLPSNLLLRQTVGQGIYSRDTRFGRYNLVFSKEPQRAEHVLDEEAQALLDGNNVIALECTPQRLMLYRHDNKARSDGMMPFVEDCLALAEIIREKAQSMPGKQVRVEDEG